MSTEKNARIKAVREKAERDALEVAFDILEPLAQQNTEVGVGEYLKHVLLAVKAVQEVATAGRKSIDDEDAEDADELFYLDNLHIVATALNVATDGIGLDNDVHPYSIGGLPFLGFAKACLVLEASANYHLAVDEPDAEFLSEGFVDEALEAVTKADEQARAREKAES